MEARVVVNEPATVVMSPVKLGNCAEARIPVKRFVPIEVVETSILLASVERRELANGVKNDVPAERFVVEALVAVRRVPVGLKLKEEEVARASEPFPKRMLFEFRVPHPVPPFPTGRMPAR